MTMIPQPTPRRIEREFGVPIPGEILDEARWTKTALKKLPPEGPLDWATLFGRDAPRVLDIGCGNGRYLLGSAIQRPGHDHIGIDILPLVLRYATRRANQRGLINVRWAACDGRQFLEKYTAPGSLREIHCYHPQPYYDSRLAHRRLLTPEFLVLVHQALEIGGGFFIQTDNAPYWEHLRNTVPALFTVHTLEGPWADVPRGRTRREILAIRRGLTVLRGWAIKTEEWTTEEARRRTASLPLPTFDAGPAPANLDEEAGA